MDSGFPLVFARGENAVDALKNEIPHIELVAFGRDAVARLQSLVKIDLKVNAEFVAADLLVASGNLFPGIGERVACDFQQLGMLANSGDISGCRLLSVSIPMLHVVNGVFRSFVIVEFHIFLRVLRRIDRYIVP